MNPIRTASRIILFLWLLGPAAVFAGQPFRWVAQFGPHGSVDAGQKLLLDSSSNIYVVGTTILDESRESIGIVKYRSDGRLLWWSTNHSAEAGDEYVARARLGPDGNLYVVSILWNPDPSIALSKFDSEGNRLWVKVRAGFPTDLALDREGNIFVGGSALDQLSSIGGLLVKFGADGGELWAQVLDYATTGMYNGQGVAVDATGAAYLTGTGFTIAKFSNVGDRLWLRDYDGQYAPKILLDAAQNVYVAGTRVEADALIVKLDSAGRELSKTIYLVEGDSFTDPFEMIMDASGDLYIAARGDQGKHSVTKLSGGDVVWTAEEFGNEEYLPASLTLDRRGDPALFFSRGSFESGFRAVLVRYNTKGRKQQVVHFPGPGRQLASDVINSEGQLVVSYYEDAGLPIWVTGVLQRP